MWNEDCLKWLDVIFNVLFHDIKKNHNHEKKVLVRTFKTATNKSEKEAFSEWLIIFDVVKWELLMDRTYPTTAF